MTRDKKVEAGQQRHVLLHGASGATVAPVDPSLVAEIITESQLAGTNNPVSIVKESR
jgi:hypothetical protein